MLSYNTLCKTTKNNHTKYYMRYEEGWDSYILYNYYTTKVIKTFRKEDIENCKDISEFCSIIFPYTLTEPVKVVKI